MGRNLERDARERALRMQRILEAVYAVFVDRGIEGVTMNEAAKACGIGVATLYRHYKSKLDLVMAVNSWVWKNALGNFNGHFSFPGKTAAENFERYLNFYLLLYRDHKDLLIFNQYFNVFVKNQGVSPDQMTGFMDTIKRIEGLFHKIWMMACEDGTLRTDMPEQAVFSTTLHLMLAAITRYAVGLVYINDNDPDQELVLLKELLIRRYVV